VSAKDSLRFIYELLDEERIARIVVPSERVRLRGNLQPYPLKARLAPLTRQGGFFIYPAQAKIK
jgi:hypothetical protein